MSWACICRVGAATLLVSAVVGVESSSVGASPRATRLPSIDELIVRHRIAVGYLPATSATWSGSITEGGTTAHYSIAAARDGRYRETVTLPMSTRAEGDNGALVWLQDDNGDVQSSSSAGRRPLAGRLLGFNAFLLALHPSATVEGTRALDGKPTYVVAAKFGDRQATLYVDVASSLVLGADIGDRSVRYSAFRRFGRLVVPSVAVETRAASTTVTTLDSLSWKNVGASTFDPPVSRQPEFPTGQDAVVMPFTEVHGLIVLDISLDGHPLHFLLDSGSSSSVIDLDTAKRLGLRLAGEAKVEGAALLTGTLARAESLEIGGIRYRQFIMEAVPLQLPHAISHYGIDGVLGYDAFAPVVARIAYWHDQIKFIKASIFSYAGTGAVIPLEAGDRIPRIVAGIGRNDKARMSVDTGSDAKLILYKEYTDSHRQDFTEPIAVGNEMAAGVGGDLAVQFKVVSRLDFGAFYLADVLASIIVKPTGAFAPTRADGIIGGGTLSLFNAVFFDYPGKRLILER